MREGRACVPCEHLEVSGEQSEHEVLLCPRVHQSGKPAKMSVGVDPLQAILTPTITAISKWKQFKEEHKHHAWLNVARLEETIIAFEARMISRDSANSQWKRHTKGLI